jgi:hypothetical protein
MIATMRVSVIAAVVIVVAPNASSESLPLPDAATTLVTTSAELYAAVAAAQPGDIIELAAGTYALDSTLGTPRPGTPEAPIIVRGGTLGSAILESSVVEAIHVTEAYWQFESLEMHGVCADDSTCEHAFHITGAADATHVTGCRLVDFNAQIKGNGDLVGPSGERVWPDDVQITGNELYDTRARQTANPVTKIDVVGGRRWAIRGNHIHDFEKAQGDFVSYAAFLKGNSRDGVMANNTVVCAQAFTGGTRIGLSLGGGGSGPDSICEDATCTPEHQNGTIHDNLIAHCSDVGIYLNEATATEIAHNTIYDTAGVDVRFAASTATVRNNLVGGAVRDRDGGTHTESNNLVGIAAGDWAAWFVAPDAVDFGLRDGAAFRDQGVVIADLVFDYCGNDRDDGAPDLGALEYDSDLRDPMVMCSGIVAPAFDANPGTDAGNPGTGDGGGGCCDAGGGDPTGSLLLVMVVAVVCWRRDGGRPPRDP